MTLESGHCLSLQGRAAALAGPAARGAFLEMAGERAPDWAGPRPRPAGVGGAFADEQARRRSFGFVKRTMAVAGEHSFLYGDSERPARKHNDGGLHWRL